MRSRRIEFLSGVKAEIPILIGVVPFGLIYGVFAVEAGIPPAAAQAMSCIVFAGSAQFIATQMVASGAPGLVVILTIGIVNLRHALYSASIAPYLKHLRPAWKWALAYLLTDEAYAVSIIHYSQTNEVTREVGDEPGVATSIAGWLGNKHWYFLGAGLALWITWQLSTAGGIFLGARIPENWSLDFALPLTFIALLIPTIIDRPSLAAALAAGLTVVFAYNMPYKLGLVTAALVGILTGMVIEARRGDIR